MTGSIWFGTSEAAVITFDEPGIMDGQIIDNEYAPDVIIRADNRWRPSDRDYAVIFDTRNDDNNNDPDLKGPVWDFGNIKNEALGNILIIEENGVDNGSGFINRMPDDEGRRPAGFIEFDFRVPITAFGFDLIDVENDLEKILGSFFALQSSSGNSAIIPFAAFVENDPSNPYYIAGLEFGNNSANRIDPITAAVLGLIDFNKVQIHLGGSGAIDNIVYAPVPVPASAVLLFSGLLGLIGVRRLRRI